MREAKSVKRSVWYTTLISLRDKLKEQMTSSTSMEARFTSSEGLRDN